MSGQYLQHETAQRTIIRQAPEDFRSVHAGSTIFVNCETFSSKQYKSPFARWLKQGREKAGKIFAFL